MPKISLFEWATPDLPEAVAIFRYSVPRRRGYLFKVEANGRVGFGECTPLANASEIGEEILGLTARDLVRFVEGPPESPRRVTNSIFFALETAFREAGGQVLPRGLSEVASSLLVGSLSDEAVIQRSSEGVRRGYRTIKVKAAGTEGLDRLPRIRERIGDQVALRVDFNRTLTPSELPRVFSMLEQVRVELVEDPIALTHLPDKISPIPVFVDEEVGFESPDRLAADPRVSGLVIKPTRDGGYAGAVRLARLARSENKRIVVTHGFEGPIALAAIAEIALAIGDLTDPSPGVSHTDVARSFHPWLPPQLAQAPGILRCGPFPAEAGFVLPSVARPIKEWRS